MTQLPAPPPTPPGAVLANLIGLLLVVAGVAGVNTAAWMGSLHLGLGVTSVTVAAVGFVLALREG